MANQIVVSAGAKVRNLSGVLTGTTGVVNSLPINAANGIPQLDVNGKILVSQLPNSVMEYKGVWNAATNTPTLVNGTGNQGDVYLCNVAGTVDFGAGAIAFVVGDQVIYSGSIWQRASGATGTVTSVAVTESGDSLNITGSPITTSGTINIGFNGTNLQYVNGAGNLTTFPTLITSIGLSMPSAFSVANSPLTANGTIAVTGAGVASQYIRGDGTLADFPSSGGGGSSVSYYLNGGTNQGTIGGTTYYEMSKTAVIGTGVDFAKSGDGFIVAFLTDANDPAQLNIPAGNWNYEIYAQMSANGGTPQMYAELYKYDGTTFTLISTSSNEIIYDGTALNLYTFAMAVPATSLTLTDRLAVKLYATNSGGKTTTIHTQDGHLCQIITTFSTGITALNGLTAQVQYFQTGTSGTDFNISSTTATHTFNIPDASASARGLITTGTQTIAGTKTFNDATKNNGGIFLQNASSNSLAGYMNLGGLTNGVKFTSGGGISNTFTLPSATGYTFTFPNATGTLALTSDISYPVTSVFGRTGAVVATSGDYTTAQVTESGNLYFTDSRARLALSFVAGSGAYNSTTGVITIPTDNSQIANGAGYITSSALSGYVTLAGTQTITGAKTFSTFTKFDGGVILKNNVSASLAGYVGLSAYSASGNKGINIDFDTYSNSFYFSGTLPYQYTFPAASGTIALVGGSGVGTVTSVAALTIGTSGTDLSSTVATSTTTPVITLNVPTASAANRGALSSADWSTFNSKQGTITLTTTGTSGAATFSSNTLNIPQYQGVLTNPVTGTGTTNYLPKFTGASTIGNSLIQDDGSTIGLGIAPIAGAKAYVYGTLAVRSGYGVQWGTNGYNLIYGDQTANELYLYTNNVQRLLIASTGAATFSSSVTNTSGMLLNVGATGTNANMNYTTFTNGVYSALNSATPSEGVGMWSDNLGNGMIGALYNNTASSLNLVVRASSSVSGLVALKLSGTGAATFSANIASSAYTNGTLIVTGGVGISGQIFTNNTINTTDGFYSGKAGSDSIGSGAYMQFSNIGYIQANASSGLDFWTLPTGGGGWEKRMRLTNGGNFLIGTTTDSGYKLDVNGTGRFSGALSGTSATFSGILAESKTADGIIQTIGGNLTKANIYQFSTGGLGGAVFNIGHNFYYDGTNYGQGNAAKPGWVISSNINADSFAIARAAAGSTSAPTGVLSFASTGAATFSDSIKTGTPSGGTAKPWKLGQDTSTLYSATRTIQVEIDGGTYYLLAVKSTDL